MEKKSGTFEIQYYVDLALKNRWFLIAPLCLAMVVGIILIFALPKTYLASNLVLVRPQSVPREYVESTVTSDIQVRLGIISRQILSRTNLEKIIHQFNLFLAPEYDDMFLEDQINDLRDRIQIALQTIQTSNKEGASTFSISFLWPDPDMVAPVVNGLTTLFFDENIRVREAQTMDTADFLEDELDPMRGQLEIVEKKIRAFRQTHMGELPEQLGANLRMLDQLHSQLDKTKDSLRSAKGSLILLENQINASQNIIIEPSDSTAAKKETDGVMSLTLLKQQLAALQTSYTDRHPDVIRLRTKITDLEAKLASGEYKIASTETLLSTSRDNINAAKFYREIIQNQDNLIRRHSELKMGIKNLELEIGEINQQIYEYQRRVENTPALEQELQTLQRDYQNIKSSHNYLLSRKLEANIAFNMERKQKGEQFEIIDRAFTPRKPISPNLAMIFVVSIFLGVNFGGGLILVKDYFDTSLKSPEEIERSLGISVLATIPKIYQNKDFRRQKLRKVMTVSSLIIATCLLAGFAMLAFIGPETTVEMISNFVDSQSI